ncbi:hypothetical protein [Sulfurirhabdus autotrophica]|uniref:hypothetical protein n=1 Tax=Sulfurirhabdus autotrophica TaxID=1706046 RepID=UPI000F614866|nr:hypothetical protein [Sulfurirhabdus autotrophica]
MKSYGDADRYNHREGNEEYSQAGNIYRLMNDKQKAKRSIIWVGALFSVPCDIQVRQTAYFC